MAHFPQLETGTVTQFPVARRQEQRTIRNSQADGGIWKAPDVDWLWLKWRLALSGMTAAELGAIEELFHIRIGMRSRPTMSKVPRGADRINGPFLQPPNDDRRSRR